jgi:ethanolamine permease
MPDADRAAGPERAAESPAGGQLSLKKVLGPVHIWGLGVGIVLVGEYMGWNFSVAKGGMYGGLVAAGIAGILYTCVAMIDSEVTSTVAAAGGQYTQAKHTIGPLMAFNVGLFLVLEYTMLEAADANVFGALVHNVAPGLNETPFIILPVLVLAALNYRGVYATLTINYIITGFAFAAILLTFIVGRGWEPGHSLHLVGLTGSLSSGMPYGWLGLIAAFQFGMWYYLGIEGTCQAAEECRSAARSIPLGTMTGIITLLIAAIVTWYLGVGLVPWQWLGQALTPIVSIGRALGGPIVTIVIIGTFCATLGSANGCINDASRGWFSMGRDHFLPSWFGAIHPRYRTPYRAIVVLVPVAVAFAVLPVILNNPDLLSTIITFSILSALLMYSFMVPNMFRFRKLWPMGVIHRGYKHPFHPIPAITLGITAIAVFLGTFLGYGMQLSAIVLFYFVASLWFVMFRYKYVRRGAQFTMPWPRPRGYQDVGAAEGPGRTPVAAGRR